MDQVDRVTLTAELILMRFACLVLAASCLLPGTLFAQAAVTPSPDLAGIAHVALRVANLDASVAFYERLGYGKAFALSRDGAVYEAFVKINDRQFLELYPTTAKDTQAGFLHLCFEGANLQAAHDYYVSHGSTPNAVRTAGAGNLLFTMPGPQTPTGPQNLEYTQYLPGSLHSKNVGEHLGEARIALRLVQVTVAVEDLAAAAAFYRDRLGFLPEAGTPAGTVWALPGSARATVQLTSTAALGFHARFALEADRRAAVKALHERNIPFNAEAGGLEITDPDGNEVLLVEPHRTRLE